MKYFLGFNRIQYFHLWVIVGYYFLQSIFGFFVYEFNYAALFFVIAVVSCCVYLFFFGYIFTDKIVGRIVNRESRVAISAVNFSCLIFGFYLVLVLYSSLTSEQIPLFMVFRGATVDELAKSREMFLRAREGWETILVYINAIFIMALVPYCVASLFYVRHKFRFYFLLLFLFSLTLTLEKSVAVMALIPIIILNVNSSKILKSKKNSFGLIVVLIIFIAAVSFLARGGLKDEDSTAPELESASSMPVEYQLFKCDSQLCYVANRITWIPYATAIDWLRYQDMELKGDYALGRSIGLVASIIGQPKINLEREVFGFQWGQNETGTGSANTVYFVDAFVNFSWFGVILYAAVLALIVKIIFVSDNIPVKCTSFVSLFYLGVNSLPPMLFSGGLIVIVLLALFFRQKSVN